MNSLIPVILTRPGEANNQLADILEDKALDSLQVWRWPAFTIELPPEDEQKLLQDRLANLDDVEMVVLPSPAAVTAVAHSIDTWPSHITLATVGEGTARVIRAAFGDKVNVLAPEGDAEHSGSEALWELVKQRGAPARVLFLRGQTGREWLPKQFKSIGSDVITLCAYVRVPIGLNDNQQRELWRAVAHAHPPLLYITSTDAVDAIVHALHTVPGALEWANRGRVVTLHPRVVNRLREAGFTDIVVTTTDVPTVLQHIELFWDRARREVNLSKLTHPTD